VEFTVVLTRASPNVESKSTDRAKFDPGEE